MKIEIKHCGLTSTVETENDDLNAVEIMDIITGLLIQLGYRQESINEAIKELAEGGNYMVIFDKSNQSSIIFASPKYDKSDRVLKKMGIKPGEAFEDDDDDNDSRPGGNTGTKPSVERR